MDAAMLPNAFADMRVLEFTHAIMGPACGMTLADLGAEVI
ncbi:MAG: CoA transferase, partial [Anaerolineae bacterium]|nr:CoA transferase [Anaerolineae bacterium]